MSQRNEAPIFAQATSVPVDKTKLEISTLLREWGCESITWAEKMTPPAFVLEFTWENDGAIYRIRFSVAIPIADPRTGKAFNDEKRRQAERSIYRLLLLKLKADLNATRTGLAKAEEIFLPWMVDLTGKTIADFLVPQLRQKFQALPPSKEATDGEA